MKVKLKKNLDEKAMIGFEESDKEREFAVLSIEINEYGQHYRLITNLLKSSSLFECEYFEIISQKIPENWVVQLNKSDIFLMPKSWTEDDFFEKYYNDEQEALKTFEKEKIIIFNSDPVNDEYDQLLEIKNLSFLDTAKKLDEEWLMCPHCIDAWESKSNKMLVTCPNCSQKLHNPRFISFLEKK